MLQNHASLRDIRTFLLNECGRIYSPAEAASISSLVLEHCNIQALRAISEPNYQPGPAIVTQVNEIVSEIHSSRPIQYVLGKTVFYGLPLKVDERVLVPRPETEALVHLIVETHPGISGDILDLGSGSGCIALALKKAYPENRVRGLERENAALELALENARNNALHVDWLEGDILSEDLPESTGPGYGLVVSNPPYVKESEKAQMEKNVLDFEPASALFVPDSDPLLFYRAIARKSRAVLIPGAALWLEINETCGKEIKSLLEEYLYKEVQIIKDLHGKERYAQAIA